MLTIVVYNSKGGVGKTTISALLAQYLAGLGYDGVILDLDLQGSQTTLFGMDGVPEMMCHVVRGERSITESMVMIPDRLIPRFKKHTPGALGLCPGGEESKAAMNEVAAHPHLYGLDADIDMLRKPLSEASADFAVLDLGPSDHEIALAALVASDYILIPTDSEHLSLERIPFVLGDVIAAQEINPGLEVLGIVPTKMEYHFGRMRPSKSQVATWAHLENNYPDLLLRDENGAVDIPYDEDWKVSVWIGEMLFSPEIGRRAKGEAMRFLNAVGARLGLEKVSYE